jgi:hypothetical protein
MGFGNGIFKAMAHDGYAAYGSVSISSSIRFSGL